MAGVFDSIKSKLGMAKGNDAQLDEYEAYEDYDEEYDDFEEFDEYDQEYDDYGDSYGYGNRHKVTTRDTGFSMPRLVSRDDARESTRGSSAFGRDSFTNSRGSRTMVDSSLPASLTPEGASAISAAGNRRAEGLDSLFGDSNARTENRTMAFESSSASASGAGSSMSFAGKRNLQVIKPSKYDDAEGVTRALKLGNVAILVLTGTSADLCQRILDFAFGAASALDGGVEGIAPRIYALTTDHGLTDTEKSELQNLGVI